MGRKLKLKQPTYSLEEINQIAGLRDQGKTLKEIRVIMGAKSTRSINGALQVHKILQDGKGSGRAINVAPSPAPAPMPGPSPSVPISIVDRTNFSPSNIQPSSILPSSQAQMTSQKSNGSVAVRRLEPIDMAGFVGNVPFPYNPESLGKTFRAGKYEVCIGYANGFKDYQIETVPDSFGPAYNPPLFSGSQQMNQPAADPASGIRAAGEVIKIVQDLGQKKDGAMELAFAKQIEAQTAALSKPVEKGEPVKDYIELDKQRQATREAEDASWRKRMEFESETRMKENREADRIARERQQDFFKELMKVQDTKFDATIAPLKKELADAKAALDGVDDEIEKKLKDAEKNNAEINKAKTDLATAQAAQTVALAGVQAELIKVRAELAGGDGMILKGLKEIGPYIKQGIEAAERLANRDPNNPALPAPQTPHGLPGPANTGGDVSDAILSSPEFKAFTKDYAESVARYMDDQEAMAAGETIVAPYTPEFYTGRVIREAMQGANGAMWMTIIDFIGKHRWKNTARSVGMKEIIWPRITEEQKTLLDNVRHEFFYEKMRNGLLLHFHRDADVHLNNIAVEKAMRGTEPAPATAPAQTTPAPKQEPASTPPESTIKVEVN